VAADAKQVAAVVGNRRVIDPGRFRHGRILSWRITPSAGCACFRGAIPARPSSNC
jgi:hypothetical protein